ncbi:hypothetical protein BDQ12DRAFT_694495 [Crucibulum laeve]|uniref:Uncharacterized protein n=1 Tax=Crucibulum laeve TaxID=68775 RepID=A0A5C3LDN8_9AGAR|nr:hypothetical protein BDQ12DRAFT_694495 [Crucibulum laeve]
MKDGITPVVTPFSLSHSAATPDAQSGRRSHYFDQRHTDGPVLHNGLETSPAFALNSLLDASFLKAKHVQSPLDLIPNEILSLILEHGYFEHDSGDDTFRLVMSQTSRRWREAVIHTPSLWSIYHISQGNIDRMLDLLPLHLHRSKDYPLDVQLNAFWDADLTEAVMEHFLSHSQRWRSLSLTTPNPRVLSHIQEASTPILESLKISQFSSDKNSTIRTPIFCGGALPKLSHLSLRNINFHQLGLPFKQLTSLEIRGYGRWPNYDDLNEILGGSESLRRLTVHIKPAEVLRDVDIQDRPPIRLPALQTFEVYTSEWLTDNISAFIQLFSCPALQTLTVHDSLGCTGPNANQDIVRFCDAPTAPTLRNTASLPSLSIWASSIHTAWQVLSPSTRLSKLELRDIFWPPQLKLAEVFAGMRWLETLVIQSFNPTCALREWFEGEEVDTPTLITIPSLRTLDITITLDHYAKADEDAARFLRLFALPALQSLALRNLNAKEWEHIVSAFSANAHEYPALSSLALADVTDVLSNQPSPVEAFPRLQQLSLSNVGSNEFTRHLLCEETSSENGPMPVWPWLNTLKICGDANASKPLLHRAITARKNAGHPISKLVVDKFFQTNPESWEWLKENIDLVETS